MKETKTIEFGKDEVKLSLLTASITGSLNRKWKRIYKAATRTNWFNKVKNVPSI